MLDNHRSGVSRRSIFGLLTVPASLYPWALLVLSCVQRAVLGENLRAYGVLLVFFAIALGPLSFVHAHSGTSFYFEGPVRAVALLALAMFAVLKPLPQATTGQKQTARA